MLKVATRWSCCCCFDSACSCAGILYYDDFKRSRHYISLQEHDANVKYVLAHLVSYFEFPPVYDGCHGRGSLQPTSSVPASRANLVPRARRGSH